MAALELVAGSLMLAGSAFVFVGGIGALRFPTLFTRIHAAGLTDTMGTLLVLGGCLLHAGSTLVAVKVAAILVLLLLTGPTATYALANAARLADAGARRSPALRSEGRRE